MTVKLVLAKKLNLKAEHYEDLKKSGLSDETIIQHGIKSLTEEEVRGKLKYRFSPGSGYIMPYPENETSFMEYGFNMRLDRPFKSRKNPSKTRRYMRLAGEPTHIFIPKPVFRFLNDNTIPLIITEGEKKALKATQEGFPTIGLSGVWGFSSNKQPSKDLDRINFEGRTVYVLYDGDKDTNPQVAYAESRLGQTLSKKGANVKILNLPEGMKLDDFLVKHGSAKLHELMDSAEDVMPVTRIPVNDNDIRNQANRALRALDAANKKNARFYIYGNILVRVEFEKRGGKPIVTPLTLDRLRYHLVREAVWVKIGRDGKEYITKPPDTVLRDILATPQSHIGFPVLEAIVETPVFNKDGYLQTQQGYDDKTRLYLHLKNGFLIPDVNQKPSPEDIARAKSLLCDELLGDYRFQQPSDKAHAIAMILLPFVRPMIEGPTPLHMIEKARPGSGASKMARCVAYIISGRDFSVLPEGENNEEWRKRITAALLNSPQLLVIDNVSHKLWSSALSSALTSEIWSDRILGRTEQTFIPVKCVWVATANNPTSSTEIARRMVRILIYVLEEKPYLRPASDFRHPNLEKWTLDHRELLIWACCTLIQAWIACGRIPGNKTFGMYESWSATMGGILDACDIEGFLENLNEFHEDISQEEEAEKSFVVQWFSEYRAQPVRTTELLKLKDSRVILNDEQCTLTQRGRETRLGKILHKMTGKTFEIEREKGNVLIVAIEKSKIKQGGSNTWYLEVKKRIIKKVK